MNELTLASLCALAAHAQDSGEYRDGALVRFASKLHGWSNNGGNAVAANSRYVSIGGPADSEGFVVCLASLGGTLPEGTAPLTSETLQEVAE